MAKEVFQISGEVHEIQSQPLGQLHQDIHIAPLARFSPGEGAVDGESGHTVPLPQVGEFVAQPLEYFLSGQAFRHGVPHSNIISIDLLSLGFSSLTTRQIRAKSTSE